MSDAPVRTVGRYDLLEVIGRGGAAVVYLANQRDLDRRVALKELAAYRADTDADATFAHRFAEESRVAGSLSHPNIVTVYEYFEHDGLPYIAMEYLSQGSLRPFVGQLRVAQIAGVLEGVLAGLAHGQARSVVHRDLKPENLLVTADGRVKIADFGVARAYADAVTRAVVTDVGTTIGTPAYMAPEQALGHEVGPGADLYSLGIVAWELLVGRVPFDETDTPMAVLYRHVHDAIPPVRSVAPDIDSRIEAWLQRMLAKDPGDRFEGAEAAWDALEDVVLELLGPRWRRDARLPVLETSVAGRPLTPAVFEDVAAAAQGLATYMSLHAEPDLPWAVPAAGADVETPPGVRAAEAPPVEEVPVGELVGELVAPDVAAEETPRLEVPAAEAEPGEVPPGDGEAGLRETPAGGAELRETPAGGAEPGEVPPAAGAVDGAQDGVISPGFPARLDPSPLDPSPLDPSPLDPSPLDPSWPDPSRLDPSLGARPVPAPGGRPTIHRVARRHDFEEVAAPVRVKPRVSRGVAIAVVVAAVVVAILLGVLLGSGGTSRAPAPRKTTPTISAATQATQLVTVLKGVASARHKGITHLAAAPTASAEASAAATVQHAYAAGVRQLAALPAPTRSSARARSIDATLTQLERLYGSLSVAARARSKARYASTSARITAAELALRNETNALS